MYAMWVSGSYDPPAQFVPPPAVAIPSVPRGPSHLLTTGGVNIGPTSILQPTGVNVNQGPVIIGNNAALGTGLVTLAGGTLQDDGRACHVRLQQAQRPDISGPKILDTVVVQVAFPRFAAITFADTVFRIFIGFSSEFDMPAYAGSETGFGRRANAY